ncbi:MAG: hypothetical protein AAFY57_00690, partial [Cyanobacteria bacterium J06642_2]
TLARQKTQGYNDCLLWAAELSRKSQIGYREKSLCIEGFWQQFFKFAGSQTHCYPQGFLVVCQLLICALVAPEGMAK